MVTGTPTGSSKRQPLGTIFRQFVAHPGQVGAVVRSSKGLGRAISHAVQFGPNDAIVEAGPGDGAITEALLAQKPASADFLAVELNPECARALSQRLPNVRVVVGDLANLPAICRDHGFSEVDSVVATLPWSIFSPARQDVLMQGIDAALKPGGQFVFYIYVHAAPFWRHSRFMRLLRHRFDHLEQRETVLWNLPPAIVFRCLKRQ